MFNPDDLGQFTGSETFYRHWTRKLIYTEGIHYLMDGAAWLVDAIASYQFDPKLFRTDLREFQLWELKVDLEKHTAVLTCKADSDRAAVVTQHIEFTDFPMEEITLYVERGEHLTLMLPSER